MIGGGGGGGGGGYAGSQISFLKDEAGLTEEACSKQN